MTTLVLRDAATNDGEIKRFLVPRPPAPYFLYRSRAYSWLARQTAAGDEIYTVAGLYELDDTMRLPIEQAPAAAEVAA